MSNVAIIPARGGSKRIPRKNIRPFAGKPIIAWSIEAALASRTFDEVIVSTDDVEIAEVAKRYGATVPALRATELSGDETPLMPVLRAHVVLALGLTAADLDAEAMQAHRRSLGASMGVRLGLSHTSATTSC